MSAPKTRQKYGLKWSDGTSDLAIILFCIQHGGEWLHNGKKVGAPIFGLYRDAQSILWPEDDHHEWSDLSLKSILENRVTAICGPKDSSKTRSIAKYALVDYFAFPKTTLILISSTQIRSLELRVWGDLKSLFNRAKEIWPDAPGVVVDSMHGIFTDQVGEGITTARDIRRGIICIPVKDSEGQWQGMDKWCFPAGSLVDTPVGHTPIEQLRPGDLVLSAVGTSRISATCRRIAKELVRIRFRDGRIVDCTPNHRLLTSNGWKKAVDLSVKDFVLSVDDSLRHLRQSDALGSLSHQILFDEMPAEVGGENLPSVWSKVFAYARSAGRLLRAAVCPTLDVEATRDSDEPYYVRGSSRVWEGNKPLHSCGPETTTSAVFAVAKDSEEVRRFGTCPPLLEDPASQWGKGVQRTRQRFPSVKSGTGVCEVVSGCSLRACHPLRAKAQRRLSTLLSTGLRLVGFEAGRRDRWGISPTFQKPTSGSSEGKCFTGAWVDCVEVLQRTGDPRFFESEGGYPVFNLEVENHPSYSVNGFVVHNCGIKQKRRRVLADECQFYSSPYLSTLANLDKGDFKGVFIGNPLGGGDPLDKLAEPEEGWGSEGEITQTTTWRNKWGGITVQLYGPDSPAVHHPGKYEYLTNLEDIERITKRYGKESAEYWMQGVGIRPTGLSLRRVLTREIIDQFGAQETVIWKGTPTTKVYAIDAAYGGDRCVGISGEFGLDINGNQVLSFNDPEVIPIRVFTKSSVDADRLMAEDQIATYVKAVCEKAGIPPQNVFFDATGRGSLGTAFARIWSSAVNPIESGGTPTPRPVSADFYVIDDKTKQRRLKRADEHYSKRVTEYWFSVRYAVEARQVRQFPNAPIEEFAAREWTLVSRDRRELETKEETKERLGHSPDFADAVSYLVEGARRLGFVISKLEAPNAQGPDSGWKDDLRRRAAALRRSYSLDYGA